MSKTVYNDNGSPRFCLGEPRGPQRTGKESLDAIARLANERLLLVAGYKSESWEGRKRYDEIRQLLPAMMDRYFADKKSGTREAGLASPKKGRVSFYRAGWR